jgi:hypothetical protein
VRTGPYDGGDDSRRGHRPAGRHGAKATEDGESLIELEVPLYSGFSHYSGASHEQSGGSRAAIEETRTRVNTRECEWPHEWTAL